MEKQINSVSEAQKLEVQRRIKSFEEGKSKFFTWEAVKEELRKNRNDLKEKISKK